MDTDNWYGGFNRLAILACEDLQVKSNLLHDDTIPVGTPRIPDSVCFVGQAPSSDSNPGEPLSGRSGRRIAEMLDVTMDYFLTLKRFNLNRSHRGKEGKGDKFDAMEGVIETKRILKIVELSRLILLGSNVAKCFGIPWDHLAIYERGDKSFLLMPHPSGINLWYNDEDNRAHAALAMKRFVYGKD